MLLKYLLTDLKNSFWELSMRKIKLMITETHSHINLTLHPWVCENTDSASEGEEGHYQCTSTNVQYQWYLPVVVFWARRFGFGCALGGVSTGSSLYPLPTTPTISSLSAPPLKLLLVAWRILRARLSDLASPAKKSPAYSTESTPKIQRMKLSTQHQT